MIMLSSLIPEEIATAIQAEDVKTIQSIKGIGAKTAQRIIIDLQDKVGALTGAQGGSIAVGGSAHNNSRQEALVALTTLGFDRNRCEKTLDQISKESPADVTVEDLIKYALKRL